MRALGLAAFLLACTLLAPPLSAQQTTSTSTSPAVSDPQAVALLQQSLAALTGGAPVTDVTLSGTARRIAGSDDETGTATLKASATQDSRVDLSFPSGQRSEIRNHAGLPLTGSLPPGISASVAQTLQPVGEWLGPDGAPHGMAGHNIMTDPAWFFPALTLANIVGSSNYVLSYVGQDTLNGQALVHVAASRPLVVSAGSQLPPGPPGMSFSAFMQRLSQMDIFLDPATFLPVAFAFNAHPDGNALLDIPVRIEFSNYQRASAMQVPLHVQKYLNNGLILDLQFTNVTLNSGLSASSFLIQ